MNKIDTISNVYFLGIGGIGMSAIARYFLQKGVAVSGYDKTETPVTRALQQEGARLHFEEDINLIDQNADLVIYTPAIPKEHTEFIWLKDNGYEVVKRSDVLQWITEGGFNICVAGTHGKTSISTMIGYLLRQGPGCNAFLGGISVNYETNFWSSTNPVNVVEADEYDRSFLKLSPDIAVITAMDADHLDIYGTVENMQDGFVQFAEKIKKGGILISKAGLPRVSAVEGINHFRYALEKKGNSDVQIYAENITARGGTYHFDMVCGSTKIENLELHIGGLHNLENMLVAISVALQVGMKVGEIREAVKKYLGVRRRFEYVIRPAKGRDTGAVMIDDYAHHPEELRALLNGAKHLYPNHNYHIIFQPHLFTRTRDLAHEFAEVLSIADEVILLPVYPARELPIEGISSACIGDKIHAGKVKYSTREEFLESWRPVENELWLLAGAGNIDVLPDQIKNKWLNKI